MTETTEEKDPFEKAKTHICGLPGFSEYFDYIRARKGHQPPTNDFLSAVSKYITSLTKERDDLKNKIDPNEYYGTKCKECGWEGSSKFVRVHHYHDDCDTACPVCNSNNLEDLDKNISDEHSIQNLTIAIDIRDNELHEKITSIESQLSNREKEIKELKEKLESPDYHYLAADWDFTWPIDDDNFLHDVFADFPEGSIIEVGTLILGPRRFYISPSTKTFFSSMDEALASLQSKEGEE